MRQLLKLKVVGFCGWLLLLFPGCICVALFRPTSPVLYKPTYDLGPVLALQLPDHISTLPGIPRTEGIVEDGFNKLIGEQEKGPGARKELSYFRKGDAWEKVATEYRFALFYSDEASTKEYEWEKTFHRVFHETKENGLTGCVYYTEQPRSDPEGGSSPMGYYISRADFRLHNLYVRVETQGRQKPPNDNLTKAVTELAQMLSVSLVRTNQVSQ